MKKHHKKKLNVLVTSLIVSSCQLNPFFFDVETAEIVDKNNKRISCHNDELKTYACFNEQDLQKINKCFKRKD
jgi:hypothetical protein